MERIKCLAAICLLLCRTGLMAQDQQVEKDVQSWIGVKLIKEFDFNLDLSFEQQVRFLEYEQTFSEISLGYTALDFLKIGGEIRFKFLQGGQTEYRLGGYMGLIAEKKDFELEYRFKATNNYSRFEDPLLVLRNKIAANYTIRKDWRIATSIEMFLPREDGRFWLRKYRWMTELRYKFTKMHRLTVFYALDRTGDMDLDDPVVLLHIFGTFYDIQW